MDLIHAAILRVLPWVPRSLLKRVAGRYIAGESREKMLKVVERLHAAGYLTTIDLLGENVASREQAHAALDEYSRVIDRVRSAGPSPEVSVKLSLLGLRFEEALARELLQKLIGMAAAAGVGVFLDMEDTSTTDATLRIYRRLRDSLPALGVAVQAYLRRSARDVQDLLPLRPSVRVCKGIYNEPETVALKGRQEIRQSFLALATSLIDGGAFTAIATHDSWLVDRSLALLRERQVKPEVCEFQMLLGVGESLRPRIRSAGRALRLYCPYGPDWLAYSMRRLKENPHMARYILSSVFSRKLLERGNLGS